MDRLNKRAQKCSGFKTPNPLCSELNPPVALSATSAVCGTPARRATLPRRQITITQDFESGPVDLGVWIAQGDDHTGVLADEQLRAFAGKAQVPFQ